MLKPAIGRTYNGALVREYVPRRTHSKRTWGNPLDSQLMRRVLIIIQAAALAGRTVSMRQIARETGKSVSIIAHYCQALRDSGLIGYEDHTEGTIHVKEWL